MSNELALSGLSDVEVNERLGIVATQARTTTKRLPSLAINTDVHRIEEVNGKKKKIPLPYGSFYLYEKDVEGEPPNKRFYAEEITVRIIARGYRYVRYKDKEGVIDESVILTSYKNKGDAQKFLSTSGRHKCGKLTGKEVEERKGQLTPEQAILQQEVRLKTMYYILVSYTGTAEDGETKEFVDVPSTFTKGLGSSENIENVIEAVAGEKRLLLRAKLKWTAEETKNGGVTYFVPLVEDLRDDKPPTKEDYEMLESALNEIKWRNSYVRKKFELSFSGTQKAAAPTDSDVVFKVVHTEVPNSVLDLNDTLDDEIPF